MRRVLIAATFTAEPIEQPLNFWFSSLGWTATIEFAPFGQIFQPLLESDSVLAMDSGDVNVFLIRLEDWSGPENQASGSVEQTEAIARNGRDFVEALRVGRSRSLADMVVVFCPCSPS